MRFNQPLDDLLGQQSKVKLIRFLVKTNAEMAGRELARAVGLAQRITHSALMELWKQGIVRMRRVGSAKLYKLNEENLFVSDALRPLFAFEDKLQNHMTQLLIRALKNDIDSIILFGSMAEGGERPDSDIDLLIIIKERVNLSTIDEKIDEISLLVSKKFGNLLSPVLLKASQFRLKYQKNDKFVKSIVKKGKIIYGKAFIETIYA
ncbi:MAG: nucleotidyltransferase domain-containing protein [Candidatus Margulisbacteria bacterium]|nr:nucleotidyltransferase domain-containing protein [Candidatus Margulisiibacteriota bacterium]